MHRVVKAGVLGSTGDLGLIAAALGAANFNIESTGASEAVVVVGKQTHRVGTIAMLLTPDEDADLIRETLERVELGGGRRLVDVEILCGVDVELANSPGTLAAVATLLGKHDIDIGGIVLVEVSRDSAVVSLGFKDRDCKRARRLLSRRFTVKRKHVVRNRRRAAGATTT
jgi:hypothetical protein